MTVAASAASDLSVDVVPLVSRPRTGGPIPAEIRFRLNRTPLLEGCLEMEFRDGSRTIGRYRTPELALVAGDKSLRLLLPALPSVFSDEIGVSCRFVTGDQRRELPLQTVIVSPSSRRTLVMAVCAGSDAASRRFGSVQQSLCLDRFDPDHAKDLQSRRLLTALARLAPDDMPTHPLAYCAYDVVAITADGLASLRERQRHALRRWVDAGGSVALFPDERVTPEQIEFLNVLDEGKGRFGRDQADRLTPPGLTLVRSGLGRAVVAGPTAALYTTGDTETWRRAVAFLWKVRKSEVEEIANVGTWSQTTSNHPPESGGVELASVVPVSAPSHFTPSSFAARQASFCREVVRYLMPTTTKMVPFSMVLGLLALFVALIGPGDWWGLGLIKRRRYTWVLLPVVTAGITLAMVKLADHYLGKTDRRGALTVADIGKDGRVLRLDRYGLAFSGRDRPLVRECRDALWAPVDDGPYDSDDMVFTCGLSPRYRRGMIRYGARGEREEEPCSVEGVLPNRFRISRTIRQWQPDLTRILSLEPPSAPLPAISWEAVDRYVHTNQGADNLRKEIFGKETGKADVYVYGGRVPVHQFLGGHVLPEPIVQAICLGEQQGLFTLLSQVSPAGGAKAEDVAVCDRDDPTQCQVAIVTRTGDEIFIQRKCYESP